MSEITSDIVRKLREETGGGLTDCKEALLRHDCNYEKAREHMRAKGLALAHRGPMTPCGVRLCKAESMGVAALAVAPRSNPER